MNRSCLSVAVALAVGISAGDTQHASCQGIGTVYCTNCGTEWTQLANKAMMVQQLVNQAQQVEAEVSQLQNMLLNTQTVPGQVWGTAVQDFNRLARSAAKSVAGIYGGNLDQQFTKKYGTYTSYLSGKLTVNDWKSKYTQWSKEASDNALYTLKGLGLQAAQMKDEQALMQQLQGLAGSAEGRMQALQVANMMAAQNVEQIQKLRQLMMMQLQMQAGLYGHATGQGGCARSAERATFQQLEIHAGHGRQGLLASRMQCGS